MLRCTEHKKCDNSKNCHHSDPHEYNSRCINSCTIGGAGGCIDEMEKTGKLIRLNVGEKEITLWRAG